MCIVIQCDVCEKEITTDGISEVKYLTYKDIIDMLTAEGWLIDKYDSCDINYCCKECENIAFSRVSLLTS